MALTDSVVKGLGAHVEEPSGVKLANGCIKTADGFIVVPRSRHREGLRTGRPTELDETPPSEQPEVGCSGSSAASVAPTSERETVTFGFSSMGQIPSQYTAIGTGPDCVVLGMIPGLSFMPPVSTGEDIKMFSLSVSQGMFAFTGLEFTFGDATRYIVLLKVSSEQA
jgi:hypothetical protein